MDVMIIIIIMSIYDHTLWMILIIIIIVMSILWMMLIIIIIIMSTYDHTLWMMLIIIIHDDSPLGSMRRPVLTGKFSAFFLSFLTKWTVSISR